MGKKDALNNNFFIILHVNIETFAYLYTFTKFSSNLYLLDRIK